MIPQFTYHPDPISTGAIQKTDKRCPCCGQHRGYEYTSTMRCSEDVESICPWCISAGIAAEKYNGCFSLDDSLRCENIAESIIDEVTKRTPGFSSWQDEEWLVCCDDACEFHGDVSVDELAVMTLESFRSAFNEPRIDQEFFESFKQNYMPVGNPAIYKWRCRHCGTVKYSADFT